MASFKTLEIAGWRAAIHGMRHPLKSHSKSDSYFDPNLDDFIVGENDLDLMRRLSKAGDPSHYKFLRMIQVWADIRLPRMVWSEFDTYKVGTTANSESTMHRLMKDGISKEDLDYEWGFDSYLDDEMQNTIDTINTIIDIYNNETFVFQEEKEKYFYAAKAFLPECYMQKRVVNLNYQVLRNMYNQRKKHRLPQWHNDFVQWVSTLPLGKELIMNEWE